MKFTATSYTQNGTLGQRMLREAAIAATVAAVFVSVRRICVGK